MCSLHVSECEVCTGAVGAVVCSVCSNGYFLVGTECVSECDANKLLGVNGDRCVDYCYYEDNNHYKRGTTLCVSACEISEYLVTSGTGATEEQTCTTCESTMANCTRCTGAAVCTACSPGIL